MSNYTDTLINELTEDLDVSKILTRDILNRAKQTHRLTDGLLSYYVKDDNIYVEWGTHVGQNIRDHYTNSAKLAGAYGSIFNMYPEFKVAWKKAAGEVLDYINNSADMNDFTLVDINLLAAYVDSVQNHQLAFDIANDLEQHLRDDVIARKAANKPTQQTSANNSDEDAFINPN